MPAGRVESESMYECAPARRGYSPALLCTLLLTEEGATLTRTATVLPAATE